MREKILVDIDDTIMLDSWKELTEEYLGRKIDLDSLAPGTYVNTGLVSPEYAQYFKEHNLYDYGFLAPDVVECIKKLSRHYDIYIASSFFTPGLPEISSIFAKRKVDFLKKYFSFLKEDRFLILGSKSLLDVDISIGDSMSDQIGKKRNFLLTRYHNKHLSDEELYQKSSIRVNSWKELMKYFDE